MLATCSLHIEMKLVKVNFTSLGLVKGNWQHVIAMVACQDINYLNKPCDIYISVKCSNINMNQLTLIQKP